MKYLILIYCVALTCIGAFWKDDAVTMIFCVALAIVIMVSYVKMEMANDE